MNFDDEAKDWDNDPKKTERAIIFAKEIIDFINPDKTMNALEFGCGTGLLSFQSAWASMQMPNGNESTCDRPSCP